MPLVNSNNKQIIELDYIMSSYNMTRAVENLLKNLLLEGTTMINLHNQILESVETNEQAPPKL